MTSNIKNACFRAKIISLKNIPKIIVLFLELFITYLTKKRFQAINLFKSI
jgi:hypothetical protein